MPLDLAILCMFAAALIGYVIRMWETSEPESRHDTRRYEVGRIVGEHSRAVSCRENLADTDEHASDFDRRTA